MKDAWENFKSYWAFASIAVASVLWVLNSQEKAVSGASITLDARISRMKEYIDARDKDLREEQVRIQAQNLEQFKQIDGKLTQILFRIPPPVALERGH